VLVPSAVSFLDPREVEERLREVVALGPLSSLDLLPRLLAVGKVVAEADLVCPDRVEDPAGPALDRLRDQRRAPLTSRAAWTRPGFGSPREKTASSYGGRRSAGRSPGRSVIAQRRPLPFIEAGATLSPVRSR
jgi:hypothetical protein